MEEGQAAGHAYIEDDLFKANDEKIISDYLKKMTDDGDYWPEHLVEDADVFNKDPREVFDSENTTFVIVNTRTEACGRTDGCESGCWRIIGRDKLIKQEGTGKFLGLKRVLKFCGYTKPREYKRSWVMEEYRLPRKWNSKQDHVICKIRLLFQTEIGFLLRKHFSYSPDELLAMEPLPVYGIRLTDPNDRDVYYLQTIIDSAGREWPSYVANDVYCVHPSTLVDLQDQKLMHFGLCIFTNRTVSSGITDGCKGGCWRILERDKLVKLENRTMGVKTVFEFREKEERRYTYEGEHVKAAWIMEEYRLLEKEKQFKVICVVNILPFKTLAF